ncbi:MAG: putative serine carboxypeptidase, partial [Streblomastix strix]
VQAHSGEQQFEEQLMETIVQMNGQYPKKKQQSGIKKISEKKLREAKGDTNEIYKHLTWLYLWNEFGKVPLEELYNALQKFNFHLFPCVEYLEQNFKFRGRSGNIEDRKFTLLPFNRNYVTINLEEDDEFRNEYILVEKMRLRLQIIQKLEKQNEENQIGLYECPICTLKYPMDDIVQCTQGHMICQFCVEDNVISGLEQGKVFIDCIAEGDCKGHYSESILLSCLSDDDLFRLDSIRMNQEIGNILKMMKGVVECPHCEYKAIIEDENNFIFECKNPRCGKKTCRKCWKDAHTPFKCKKELEDAAEQMRKFVEEYMTNAASCQCENCHARLVKEVGANVGNTFATYARRLLTKKARIRISRILQGILNKLEMLNAPYMKIQLLKMNVGHKKLELQQKQSGENYIQA